MGSALRRLLMILASVLAACGEEKPSTIVDAPEPSPPPSREAWWDAATKRASGQDRVLAPRELRGLLAEGRRYGFDRDALWWAERARWANERILKLDPDDIEANAGAGRRTLQSIEGFEETWKRMQEARFPGPLVESLLDQYGPWVLERRPIFLSSDELTVMEAKLREAVAHLDRMKNDPNYGKVQNALRRVRSSFLSDYPFIHHQVGPFLVFYAARDLQVIPGEDEAAEADRVKTRAEFYRRRLESWQHVYEGVLKDIATLYPEVVKRHPIEDDTVFHQWIFGEREWYGDHRERLGKEEAARPYRVGYFDGASGWAFLAEPGPGDADGPDPDDKTEGVSPVLKETAAYLAAVQILRHWGQDRNDPTRNHLDTSRAYWLKEGWPCFLAARQVKKPAIGSAFRSRFELPDLQRVVERRSHIDRGVFVTVATAEGAPLFEGGYSDLAWILVRYLNEDERRPRFEAFLLSQIEGTRRGFEWFEECFGVKGAAGWKRLQDAVYRGTED